MADAIFVPDGDAYKPTELAVGPWDPDSLHGGAPAALLARALEQLQPEAPMMVARVAVDLLRPVTTQPLTLTAEVTRPGRRVQLVEARLTQAGAVVAVARAVRIRTIELALPETMPRRLGTPPGPQTAPPSEHWPGFGGAFDRRPVKGDFLVPGPATVWFRLLHPMVAGEPTSPLQRVMAAADFGNGVSQVLNFQDHLFINPDLSVHLHRMPEGEWICLEAETSAESTGVGMAESRLYDERGPIGRAIQTLLIDERRQPLG